MYDRYIDYDGLFKAFFKLPSPPQQRRQRRSPRLHVEEELKAPHLKKLFLVLLAVPLVEKGLENH